MNYKKVITTGFCVFLMSCASVPHPEKRNTRPNKNPMNTESLDDDSSDQQTRYQVIQEGFDHADQMPVLNDFDPLDEPNPVLTCSSVKFTEPNKLSEMVIKQMMVQMSGAADYDPLFPGSFDHVETRLVIGKNNGWVNSQNLTNDLRRVFDLARVPGSLVIKINENKFGVYQDIGAPAEVWLRKSSQRHIFFKVYKLDAERKRNEVFIGYCYPKGSNPEGIPSSATP